MAMYRILHKLDIGKNRFLYSGSFNRLEWLEESGLARLERKGAICRVKPPPLEVLPGWASRAEKVVEVTGLKDAEAFLEADPGTLAAALEEDVDTIRRWQKEIEGHLTAEPAPQG